MSDEQQPVVQPGFYLHFKGGRYQVLEVVRHTETEEWMVLYRALYGERGLWVRPLSSFCDSVDVLGEIVPRFSLQKASSGLRDSEESGQ
ncbi:TonB box-like protein [Pokkaliibacter plantistimulans]|uniref:TonB box-like protein n=1 Tax=Pokkaliibacter plantistimulans TaxID=1635171 RepID=A0ABX5LZ08_9GAMM|nr:DUF1653 domain-containing protein [Pokkaliibacter plantistimulans]PXF31915.1 TonB box-like protein [Pokkaliibacter plantistimulans]